MNKVPSAILLEAGLETLKRNGHALTKRPSRGRSMIYSTVDNRSVRIRTCNDHVLIALADSADADAPMNIEGTDLLLIVMPAQERTMGSVVVFLVPSEVAAEAARDAYKGWLSKNPQTRGNNKTRNLWFDSDLSDLSHGYMERWEKYRFLADVSTVEFAQDFAFSAAGLPDQVAPERHATGSLASSSDLHAASRSTTEKLGDVIARARREIAEAAGVAVDNIQIRIDVT